MAVFAPCLLNTRGRTSRPLLLLLLIVSCFTRSSCSTKDSYDDHAAELLQFFRACQSGPLSKLQSILTENADWVSTRRTATGETCLHLASLTGQADTIRWLVDETKHHAQHLELDARTRGDRTLRETPLSMSVKNGHVEAARVLLEAGANVNLEFDSESWRGIARDMAERLFVSHHHTNL